MKGRVMIKTVSALIISLSISSTLFAGSIIIPDGGNHANCQEDTRPLGFARSLGQAFVVPSPTSENMLTSFSFFVDAGSSPVDVDMGAYLYEFNTSTESPTGSALFNSGAFAVNAAGELKFTVSVTLDPAKTYMAFISTSGLQDEDNNAANIEADQTGNGGGYRYTGIITDMTSFTGDAANWNKVTPDWDFHFEAHFAGGGGGDPDPNPAIISIDVDSIVTLVVTGANGAAVTPQYTSSIQSQPQVWSDVLIFNDVESDGTNTVTFNELNPAPDLLRVYAE